MNSQENIKNNSEIDGNGPELKKFNFRFYDKSTSINNQIIFSTTLSDSEKLLLFALEALPDSWVIYQNVLAKMMGWGRDKMRMAMKTLIDLGYVRRKHIKRTDGTFLKYLYECYMKPIFKDNPDIEEDNNIFNNFENNQITENPSSGQIHQVTEKPAAGLSGTTMILDKTNMCSIYKNHHHHLDSESRKPDKELIDDDDFLFLKKFNFSSDVLHKLKKYSLSEIQRSVEVLENQVGIQNPIGFLFRAIENPEKYPLPTKYDPEKQKKESEDEMIDKIQKRRDFCGDLDKKWREHNTKNNIRFGDDNYIHYYCNFNYVEIKSEKIFFKDVEFSKKLKDLLNKNNLPLIKKEK